MDPLLDEPEEPEEPELAQAVSSTADVVMSATVMPLWSKCRDERLGGADMGLVSLPLSSELMKRTAAGSRPAA